MTNETYSKAITRIEELLDKEDLTRQETLELSKLAKDIDEFEESCLKKRTNETHIK